MHKPDTVKKYLTRINTVGVEKTGYPIDRFIRKLVVKRTFLANAKRIGPAAACKRLPLTIDILARAKSALNFDRHNDRALWAILCVGVFALVRIGELVPGSGSKLKVMLKSVSILGDRGELS